MSKPITCPYCNSPVQYASEPRNQYPGDTYMTSNRFHCGTTVSENWSPPLRDPACGLAIDAQILRRLLAASKGLSAAYTGKVARSVDPSYDYRTPSKGVFAFHLQSQPDHVVDSVLQALRQVSR